MMTRNAAYMLRNMIHAADTAAREERVKLLSEGLTNPDRIQEIERERSLACVAAVKIWEVREAPEGHTDPAIKLWNALRRAASINFVRWVPVLVVCEKIFRGNPLTPSEG